jgi:hypothetical protein
LSRKVVYAGGKKQYQEHVAPYLLLETI